MKIIFDFGANKGQNLKYFLDKADIVIAIEANYSLTKKIESDFKEFINSKKLIVRNIALTDNENLKTIDFYISKTRHTHSTLYPDDISKFLKKEVECIKASSIIKKYLNDFNILEIEYIKIDIEGADKVILNDLLKNNIVPKNLSIEVYDTEILDLLIKSPYKSFKFIPGPDLSFKKNVKVINKNNKEKNFNFEIYSSGPYGEDIPGVYYSKKSILPYFLNNGLRWCDIHCSLLDYDTEDIIYNQDQHYDTLKKKILNTLGFKYHLKNLIPTFLKGIKNRLKRK